MLGHRVDLQVGQVHLLEDVPAEQPGPHAVRFQAPAETVGLRVGELADRAFGSQRVNEDVLCADRPHPFQGTVEVRDRQLADEDA